jgi:hypothetical protein
MSGPLTDLLAIEHCVSQAVRSRVYRDEVHSEVEIPLESRLTAVIQHCSNRVRVSLSAPRGSDHSKQPPNLQEKPPLSHLPRVHEEDE